MNVVMLDIIPFDLSESEKNEKSSRNRIADSSLVKAIKSKPAALYKSDFSNRIKTGNFEDDFDSRKDPKGNKYFWMTGEMIDNDKNFKSDSVAVKNNYASVTPIGYHLSKLSEIEKIEDILLQKYRHF